MKYGTWMTWEDDGRVEVITSPKKTARTYRYSFVKVGSGVWMLARERDWYTEHVLTFAAGRLDGHLVRKQMHASQTTFDDFDGDGPSDPGRVGTARRVASAD